MSGAAWLQPVGATCVGEKPQVAKPTLSATTHTCGHQNKEEPERRDSCVLMQHRCPVSGKRQICPESTGKQSNGLSFREVTRGQGPLSLSYNNGNNNTTGNICSSAMITRHCDETADTSGEKTRQDPCFVGLPLQ